MSQYPPVFRGQKQHRDEQQSYPVASNDQRFWNQTSHQQHQDPAGSFRQTQPQRATSDLQYRLSQEGRQINNTGNVGYFGTHQAASVNKQDQGGSLHRVATAPQFQHLPQSSSQQQKTFHAEAKSSVQEEMQQKFPLNGHVAAISKSPPPQQPSDVPKNSEGVSSVLSSNVLAAAHQSFDDFSHNNHTSSGHVSDNSAANGRFQSGNQSQQSHSNALPPSESPKLELLCLGTGTGTSFIYDGHPSPAYVLTIDKTPLLLIGAGPGVVRQCLKYFGFVPDAIFIPNNRSHCASELPTLLSVEASKGRRLRVIAEAGVCMRLQTQRLGELHEGMKAKRHTMDDLAEFIPLQTPESVKAYAARRGNDEPLLGLEEALSATPNSTYTTLAPHIYLSVLPSAQSSEWSGGLLIRVGERPQHSTVVAALTADSGFSEPYYRLLSMQGRNPVLIVDARQVGSPDHASFQDVSKFVEQLQTPPSSSSTVRIGAAAIQTGANSPTNSSLKWTSPCTTFLIGQYGLPHEAPAPRPPYLQTLYEGCAVTVFPTALKAQTFFSSEEQCTLMVELLHFVSKVRDPQAAKGIEMGRAGDNDPHVVTRTWFGEGKPKSPTAAGRPHKEGRPTSGGLVSPTKVSTAAPGAFSQLQHQKPPPSPTKGRRQQHGRKTSTSPSGKNRIHSHSYEKAMERFATSEKNIRSDPYFVNHQLALSQPPPASQEPLDLETVQFASPTFNSSQRDERKLPPRKWQNQLRDERYTGHSPTRGGRSSSPSKQRRSTSSGSSNHVPHYPTSNPYEHQPKKIFFFNNEEKTEPGKLLMIQHFRTLKQLKMKCGEMLNVKPVGELFLCPPGLQVEDLHQIQHGDSIVVTKHGGEPFTPLEIPVLLKRKLEEQLSEQPSTPECLLPSREKMQPVSGVSVKQGTLKYQTEEGEAISTSIHSFI